MEILNGQLISQKILDNISSEVEDRRKNGEKIPRLDIILLGDEYATVKYVQMKEKASKEIGIEKQLHHLSIDTSTEELVNLIETLNRFDDVDGIMVQLPLPEHIDTNTVLNSIEASKDVDGLTATNLGKLFQKDPSAIAPATPLGIMKLLKEYNIEVYGKQVVILGTSKIVGIPLLALMLREKATVTLCNSKTPNIKEVSKQADILVSATGVPLLVKASFLKQGVVVIDVGSNKHPITGKLVGDVDYNNVGDIPSYITPVPGGVGPMTVACLMENVLTVSRKQRE